MLRGVNEKKDSGISPFQLRIVNETLYELKVVQHPDKMFAGCVGAGFEFLGYRFGAGRLAGAANAT